MLIKPKEKADNGGDIEQWKTDGFHSVGSVSFSVLQILYLNLLLLNPCLKIFWVGGRGKQGLKMSQTKFHLPYSQAIQREGAMFSYTYMDPHTKALSGWENKLSTKSLVFLPFKF